MTYARSLLSRNLLENHFFMLPPTERTEHDSTSVRGASSPGTCWRTTSLCYLQQRGRSTTRHPCAGCWGDRFRRAFFDIRVFYPNASSYRYLQLSSVYRRHENEKKRNYEDRVKEVEHGSFTPLVFSTSGGMGGLATTTYKRLASQIATKKDQP